MEHKRYLCKESGRVRRVAGFLRLTFLCLAGLTAGCGGSEQVELDFPEDAVEAAPITEEHRFEFD